ncbi:hypothetical protein ARMSODRAFT_982663 [Armillaria solidipes]|uniref:Uncharacterized protein n=1 Tax=Armillaria solidipes TaxID=1076256 RepID=A0A2H3ATD5_9AGAR|nr:hypothetical protein ARMSODRAFT_982663 [Armillaria solidipes]
MHSHMLANYVPYPYLVILIVIIPILCTILGIVLKGIQIYHACFDRVNDIEAVTFNGTMAKWKISYITLTLATTLCGSYVDVLVLTIREITPTLLIGHVAAEHARPDDSWQKSGTSTVSSLDFGTGTVSTQKGDDITQSAELDEMDNLNPRPERNSTLIEKETPETRSLDMV